MNYFKMSLLAVLAASSMSAFAADNGTLTITGDVKSATCSIPYSTISQTVDFGQDLVTINLAKVNAGGVISSKDIKFDITNCPNTVNGVKVKFDFTSGANNYLVNTAATPAQGAAVGLSTSKTAAASASGVNFTSTDFVKATGVGTVTAYANLYRTSDAVTTGVITSSAIVTLTSN